MSEAGDDGLAAAAREGIDEAVYRKRWWTLSVLTLSLVMVVMGNSSLNVAIPEFQRDLGASITEIQWIIDGYALVFGGLLLTMGAMGDRFGRKGALQVGLALFGMASLWAALFASDATDIIIARSTMGLAAALVMPATLSILTTVFPREERGKAIGIWAAFAGLGGMIGLIASGALLEAFAWPSIFYLNVPVVTLALAAGIWLVPTSRDPNQAPLDIVGSTLSIFALGGFLFAIIEGPNEGWTSALILGTFAGSILLGVLFVLWERYSSHPMLPMEFFRERGFNAGVTVVTLTFFAMFATMFGLTQYMQFVLGFTALETGLRFLPLGLGMIVAAPNSDRLVRKLGSARPVVVLGLVLVATALLSMAFLDVDSPYWRAGTGFLLMGLGMGFSMAPSTTVIMSSIPARKAGVGSSMNDTAREVGGALGVAILGSILKAAYGSGLTDKIPAGAPAAAREAALDGLGGAYRLADRLAEQGLVAQSEAIVEAANAAFVDGMFASFLTASVMVYIAAGIVFLFYPRRVDTGAHGPHESPPERPAALHEVHTPPPGGFPVTAEHDAVVGWAEPGIAAWRYVPPAGYRMVRTNPARHDAVVVAVLRGTLGQARLVGLDADTGRLRWHHDLEQRLDTTPRIEAGSVVVSADGGGVGRVRIDAATGRLRGRLQVRGRSA